MTVSLVQQGIVPADEIYSQATNQRLEDIFDNFFAFANTHLQAKRQALHFPTSYLYYRNDFRVNAFARSRPVYKLIGINYGCVEQMHDFFEENADIFEGQAFQSINAVAIKLGNPTYYAFFQFFSMFVYYHEFAHLVQRSPLLSFEFDEAMAGGALPGNVLNSHAYEFDADWYAAGNIALHVTQYFPVENGVFAGTTQEVADLISIAISAILCYFLKAAGHYDAVYYEEKKHPHPFVRISYIVVAILNSVGPNLPGDFALNKEQILTSGIVMAEQLLMADNENPVMHFAEIFWVNSEAIENYIQRIIDVAVGIPELIRNRPQDDI